MITDLVKYLIRFIALVLVQVVLLNNIQFSGYINPFVYILFLIILPVHTPKLLSLVVAFITGLIVDMFGNSMGMHASACLVLAYLRPFILRIIAPRDGYETEAVPSIKDFGFKWFLIFTLMLTFVHHAVLFYLEVFRFTEFFTTMLRVFTSTIASVITIVIIQFLFSKQVESRK